MVYILAIESSCDDTGAAVVCDGVVLSNCVATQEVHRLYGGVVPEVASRAHQVHLIPVVDQALKQAGVSKNDIHAVAFTNGPGLLGALLVGASFAKGFALAQDIPLIAVHHMKAHVLAHFAEAPKPPFPFLCLTVSGGHTQIVRIDSPLEHHILGRTHDDAAGEAFDKSGKLLGLDYPAGPHMDRLARQGTARFPLPEAAMEGLNFSFSGLKTAVLYFLKKETATNPNFIAENLPDLCASIQEAIVRILLKKLRRAARETGIRHVAIAGGVSANSSLRDGLTQLGAREGWTVYVPRTAYCTDNAAMIGIAGYFQYLQGDFCGHDTAPFAREE